MARAEPATTLTARREGAVLRLAGILDRAAATTAWPSLQLLLAGAQVLDLGGVQRLDSAGLALLAEVVARGAAAGHAPRIDGAPAGLAELRAAYRLDEALAFADPAP